jgi:homocysteine S-methyltransferase
LDALLNHPAGMTESQFALRLAERGRPLILDGGLATELERAGCDLNHPLWSARVLTENPGAIESVTRNFAGAGADILATATYQATYAGLAHHGYDRESAEKIFHQAVALTRRVADSFPHRPLVAVSVGPYGAFLADGSEYRGQYGLTARELADFHRDRLATLAETEADLFAFETFPCALESRVVADLLADEFPGRVAWISFSCLDGTTLWDGTPVAEIARELSDHPAITALGANCFDPRHGAELVSRLRESAPEKEVFIYPNAGRGWDAVSRQWRGEDSPETFAAAAREWIAEGATGIGGCCQATPAHIAALAALL